MDYLKNLTDEQRKELREKSRLTKEAKKKAGENLYQDFGDDLTHWRSLASKAGVRLPASYIVNSEIKYVRRVAAKLDIDLKEYLEACGASNLKQLAKMNPSYPAYAEVGILLEWWHDKQSQK